MNARRLAGRPAASIAAVLMLVSGGLVVLRGEPYRSGARGQAAELSDPRNGWLPASEQPWSGAPARPPARALPAGAVPRTDPAPPARPKRSTQRVRELSGGRTANSRLFLLADGRLQREVSATPLNYRTGAGAWQPIDTTVRPSNRPGFGYANETNSLHSYFGTDTDGLVSVQVGADSVSFGLPDGRAGSPVVTGSSVRYAAALGAGTDLSYEATAGELKERIILAAPPPGGADLALRFTVTVRGLMASQRADGSIVFARPENREPVLVMPAPFMMDAAADGSSPYDKVWSGRVSQTLAGGGDRLTITVRADGRWLSDPARRYPVVLDPTVKVAPTPTESQDTMILSDDAGSNFDSSWRLSVGTTGTGVARSLLRFPLTGIPPGTQIDTAQLQLYYDQSHTSSDRAVTVEAHRATAAWDETTATWSNASNNVGEIGSNTDEVDDGDFWQTAANGTWPYATGSETSFAVNTDYAYNSSGATGEAYTWYPIITEPGTYRVQVHYVTGTDRATNAPYTVNDSAGATRYLVNQSATGAGGAWKTLGVHAFTPGSTANVVLGGVSDVTKKVVADAIRVSKDATAVRPAGDQGSHWHSFSVRDIVQGWLAGTTQNYGFVVKATDETTTGAGGPRYEGSIYAYNGETATYPRLVVTYGLAGVAVNPPTTMYATGAQLSWPAYVDTCGLCGTADDIVEYQVHRSVHQTFTPSADTLVAPVPPGMLTYTDSTAVPTPADDPDPFGNAYYYMVAVKTKDGTLIPGPTQIARLPKAGRVTKVFQSGVVDTTLSSLAPDANLDRLDGQSWLSVGNNSTSYGSTRAVMKFPVSGIPTTARVLDAQVKLWTATVIGDQNAVWELHGLTRDFAETQATWNRASTAAAWTAPGGDIVTTATDAQTSFTNDPRRRTFDATALARGWITDPASNKGVLLKLANDSLPASRALFLSSEADEPELCPQLVVTYLEAATPDNTYYVPDTPLEVAAGTTMTTAATVTNTTSQTLSKLDWVLSYRWNRPDGTAVATPQLQTALPADLAPGAAVTVQAQVSTPAAAEGNERVEQVLSWDLLNKTTGKWLSGGGAVNTVGALTQSLAVEDATSDQVGLETFYAYVGRATGAGTTVLNNLHAGNTVWSYDAFTNPSRGLATFLRMAYNSKDTSDSVAGFGWSVQASSVMRLGTPIDPHPNSQGRTVSLTDGDGTTHVFTLDDKGTADTADDVYRHPAGVHLFLQRLVECKPQDEVSRAWVMTKPDRTQFFFDCAGYESSMVDNNGNEMDFVYEARRSNNQPTKFLRQIIDPAGRRTLTVDYFAKGDAYDYIDDVTWTRKSATNLTNPHIIDHIKQITDISGRTVTFTFTDKGLLGELVDGAGSAQPKVFKFAYDMTQGNKNVKLVRVTDPRGNATNLAYYSAPGDDPKFMWSTKTITDRLGGVTSFAYTDPDGTSGQQVQTVMTDAESHPSTYLMDGRGRPTQTVDAKNQVTKLSWDADNNMTRLDEAGGAIWTWSYDQNTGYPTEIRDAEANNNSYQGTILTYQTGLNGNIADLIGKQSPEGRRWTFGYTTEGDLASVTDPVGNTTPAAADYTTRYSYDTWGQLLAETDANGNTTSLSDYDPNGCPTRITDPLGRATTFGYDVRGNVTGVTNALGRLSTQTYDAFGRPLQYKVPKDQAGNVFITTPAPVYDANDNLTRSTAANGAVTDAAYDAADQLSFTLAPKDNDTDPQRKTSYTYDRLGHLLTETEPKGNLTSTAGDFTTTYTYDEIYRLTAVTNALNQKLSYVYDTAGNVSKVIDPRKNATADTGDFAQMFWYDLDHRVRVKFDALTKGAITDYDRDGLVKAVTDKAGNRSELLTDARGMLVQLKVPQRNDAGTITYRVARYEYDQVGNRTRVITPRGTATGGVADDFAYQTVYDPLNRVKERLTPYDPGDAVYNKPDRTIYSYDEVGNLSTVSAPPSAGQTVRNDTTYTYYDNGWIKTATDPWDITTYYDYDDLGQQKLRIIGAAGGSSASRWMLWDHFPDGTLKSRSDTGVGGQVVLADNSDFNNTSSTGTWSTSSSGTGFQGYDYRTHAAGSGTDAFGWGLVVPRDGNYDVYVRYPAVSGAATGATFRVTHASGSTEKAVNQTTNAGTWVSLGRYPFTAGNAGKVTLTQNAGGIVVADAVKLVRDMTGESDSESVNDTYTYDPNGNLAGITDGSSNRRVDTYSVGYTQLNQVAKVQEFAAGALRNTTSLTYNPNGAVETVSHDQSYARYDYDVRDLVAKATNGKSATDPAPKVTTFTYTDKGERLRTVKANGNTVDDTYFLDGSLNTAIEKKPNGTLVSSHTLSYDLNGDQTSDVARKMNADNHAAYLDTTTFYIYDPRDRIAKLVRAGAGADTESYVHDADNNVVSRTVKGITTNYRYDRNRLLTADAGGVTASYNYDPFGRLDTVTVDGHILESNVYDGFDHVIEHRATAGGTTTTTRYTYDPLDRTTGKTTDAGTAREKTTTFNYLGLSREVLNEQVAGVLTRSYQYSPWGERLSQVTVNTSGAEEAGYYGYTAHTDVETVTDQNGDTKATYGYTAYGGNEDAELTGIDKPDATNPTKEPYNPYRFNAKRWDQGSATYDMGFRDYSPGLNRFLSRDMYNGALADLRLGTSPFTANRYAFGSGNPISTIEFDGHIPLECTTGELSCQTDSNGSWRVKPREDHVRLPTYYVDQSWIKGDGGHLTEEQVSDMVHTTDLGADVSDLGLKLCDSSGCAPITKVVKWVGRGTTFAGLVIECRKGVGPCLQEAGLDVAEKIPVVGEIVIVAEVVHAVGLDKPYFDILNHLIRGYQENFGTQLTYDPEVVDEYDQPVMENGSPNPYINSSGVPTAPNQPPAPGGPCTVPRGVNPEDLKGCLDSVG